jgi:hypothetical protein
MKLRRQRSPTPSAEIQKGPEISPAEELGMLIMKLSERKARRDPRIYLRLGACQIKLAASAGNMDDYIKQADFSYANAIKLMGDNRGAKAEVALRRIRAFKTAGLHALALAAIDGSAQEWTTALDLQKAISVNDNWPVPMSEEWTAPVLIEEDTLIIPPRLRPPELRIVAPEEQPDFGWPPEEALSASPPSW